MRNAFFERHEPSAEVVTVFETALGYWTEVRLYAFGSASNVADRIEEIEYFAAQVYGVLGGIET